MEGLERPEFPSSDEEADTDDPSLDLAKTLPPNFHFPSVVAPEQLEEEAMRKRGIHHHSLSSCGVPTDDARNHPMAGRETNLFRLSMGLGHSDPSLLGQSSSPLTASRPEEEEARGTHRAKSFNVRKTATCGVIGSPSLQRLPLGSIGSLGNSPRNSPGIHQDFGRYWMRGDSERGRRFSMTSVTSGYQTEGSPSDLSAYGSCGELHQLPFKPQEDHEGLIIFKNSLSEFGHGRHRRGRSLSPPYKSPKGSFNSFDMQARQFRQRFKKAKVVMEEKLEKFLDRYSDTYFRLSDGTLSFIKSQVLKHAEDLLKASKSNTLDSSNFVSLSASMEKLLQKVYAQDEVTLAADRKDMTRLMKHLLAIISQPARLLECMEINPEHYLLSDPEALRFSLQSPSHMPFILSKLNLTLQTHEAAEQKKRQSGASMQNVTLHDFERVKLISQGAYSSVHLVRLKQTDERFAMKKVNKQRMLMKKQVDQVFHERDILTYAENPFVVGFLCTFQTKHHLYYVMEYVEGGDLASLIKSIGCLPVEMARMYFAETLLALEYIHSLGIIHRDLKPDNLLITCEGHIKLTDFGLSKVGLASVTATMVDDHMNRDRQFRDSKVLGTPDYIAPEVILGQPYGFAVDWWSMGVILYEMLLSITPFCSTTVEDLFEEITNENLKIEWPEDDDDEEPPPKEAQTLVENLLVQDPGMRLGSQALGGTESVKMQDFFEGVNWHSLLKTKAELFVPELQGEEDTSYFDTRSDRYNNDNLSEEEESLEATAVEENPFIKFDSQSRRMSILLSDWSLNSSYDSQDENKRKFSEASSTTVTSEEGGGSKMDQQLSDSEEMVTAIDDVTTEEETPEAPRPGNRRRMSVKSAEGDTEVAEATPIITMGVRHGRSNSETPPMPTKRPTHTESERNRRSRSIDQVGEETKRSSQPSSGSQALSPRNSLVLTAPVFIKKGDKGFGFRFKAVRVYIGESDDYRLHHIVERVEAGGPAEEAGLKPDYVITHVNGEAVTGLTHTQVWQLMLSGKGGTITIHSTSLEDTSIRRGGRKRQPTLGRRIAGKLSFLKPKSSAGSLKLKKRSTTIFRRRSTKKDKDRIPHRPQSPDSSSSQSSPRDPKRSDSFKERMKHLKFPSPRRRNTTPVSPLVRTPSPTSLHLTIKGDRSSSTSPLTQIGSPASSPTGSAQQLDFGESPPDSPPKPMRKPERSSSLFTKSPHEQAMVHQRPERHSFYGQSNLAAPPHNVPLLQRRPSGSDLVPSPKGHVSPLVKHTRSPETKKKHQVHQPSPSPKSQLRHNRQGSWSAKKTWFDKQ